MSTPQPLFDQERTCVCDDPDVDTLRQMVADGLGQWEASVRLWGGPPDPVTVRAWVRAEFARSFGWLRLPGDAA